MPSYTAEKKISIEIYTICEHKIMSAYIYFTYRQIDILDLDTRFEHIFQDFLT